jgi:hypothetical protein
MTTKGCWALVFACSASTLVGEDYCSLTVRVLSPDGRRPGASVSVKEENGRVKEQEADQESGDVRFCDLGGVPVTVTVGNDECNQVIVRGVPVSWNDPYLLTVTYDPEPCLRELPRGPIPICRVIFRVADGGGKWVDGATINLPNQNLKQLTTDRFGRASIPVKLRDDVRGSVNKGADSVDFSFRCAGFVHEEHITLGKR